jgi:hypothetical protein
MGQQRLSSEASKPRCLSALIGRERTQIESRVITARVVPWLSAKIPVIYFL